MGTTNAKVAPTPGRLRHAIQAARQNTRLTDVAQREIINQTEDPGRQETLGTLLSLFELGRGVQQRKAVKAPLN